MGYLQHHSIAHHLLILHSTLSLNDNLISSMTETSIAISSDHSIRDFFKNKLQQISDQLESAKRERHHRTNDLLTLQIKHPGLFYLHPLRPQISPSETPEGDVQMREEVVQTMRLDSSEYGRQPTIELTSTLYRYHTKLCASKFDGTMGYQLSK